MPEGELVGPEIGRFGVMPVGENGIARPDGTDVEAAIGILEEEVVCRASVVGFISVDGQSPGLTQSKVLMHLKHCRGSECKEQSQRGEQNDVRFDVACQGIPCPPHKTNGFAHCRNHGNRAYNRCRP